MDSSGQVKLRSLANAPGHIRDTAHSSSSSSSTPTSSVSPTKLAEQASQGLEGLFSNSKYSHLTEQITYAVEFIAGPDRCVLNSLQLLVWLSANLYPQFRYIDLLRVSYNVL